MHASFDLKATLGGQHPHLFFLLASALRPRMLMTLDTEGKLLPVPVRVGQAVDTVAQVRCHCFPSIRDSQCLLECDCTIPYSSVGESVGEMWFLRMIERTTTFETLAGANLNV